jgi:ABC-type maltose transport system permease subunit
MPPAVKLLSSRALIGATAVALPATLLVMAPVIILFFFAQKAFIEGVTLTGVKG